jgi:hypothetical protein
MDAAGSTDSMDMVSSGGPATYRAAEAAAIDDPPHNV